MTSVMDRKAQAERLLNDPLLVEAFAEIEANCTELWKEQPPFGPADARDKLHMQIWALRRVRDYLDGVVMFGKNAETMIRKDVSPKKILGVL